MSQSQKDTTLYDSTSKALSQNHSNRKQNGGCQGLEGGEERMLSWRLIGIESQFYKIKSSGDSGTLGVHLIPRYYILKNG